jgi:hypothetical protein
MELFSFIIEIQIFNSILTFGSLHVYTSLFSFSILLLYFVNQSCVLLSLCNPIHIQPFQMQSFFLFTKLLIYSIFFIQMSLLQEIIKCCTKNLRGNEMKFSFVLRSSLFDPRY